MSLRSSITLFSAWVSLHWQLSFRYRLGLLIWALNGVVSPFVSLAVWLAVQHSSSLTMSSHQLITYFVLSIVVVRLTQSWVSEDISNTIKEGSLSQTLIKPIPFVFPYIAKDLSTKVLRILVLLPVITIAGFFWHDSFHVSIHGLMWLVVLLILIFGYVLSFLIDLATGLTAFWLTEAYGSFLLMALFKQLFAGALIPLALMPLWLRDISIWLPFRYMLSFPIEIMVGSVTDSDIFKGILIMSLWIIVSTILAWLCWNRGIKKYTAVGI